MSKIQNKQQKRKQVESSSSSSSSSSSDSDYDDDEVSSIDEKEVSSKAKYTKFLSKMYPSKHMSNKVKEQTKVKNSIINTKKSVCDKKKTNEKRCNKRGCDKKSKKESSSSESSDSESDSDYVDEEDSESEVSTHKSKKSASVNIFLTVDDNVDDESWEDDDSWEDEDSDESEDEDEDVSVSSDDDDDSENTETTTTPENNIDSNNQLLTTLLEIQDKNKNNKIINDCVETCKTKIQQFKKKQEKKQVKQKEKNQRIFKKILNNRKLQNEVVYFKKMPVEEQKVIIKELRAVNKIISVEKPYRLSLLESTIPIQFKSVAMKKINLLKSMDQYCSEYYKVKHWVDSFMRIPFGKYHNLEVTIQDGIESSHAFMENAKNILDSAVYGLNDAKMQIMQMLGQLITNPQAVGSAIAIKGPMGTGKTTLVKEGISKILNRPFAFIALGGATDSSFLEGHSYTYEGSIWGKIVQILMDSKCMNPVIYFDELDKISDTPKGEEIVGILTHLTDTSQNSQFHDKYFSEIDFDISKCLFIFSYNDESKVNPILRDRMYRIQTKGYDKKQKTIIANQYILPKIRDQVKFEPADIIISDDVIHYIIENFCEKEDGVRNQKRCLEIIYTKLNLYRLMRPDSNLFEQEMSIKVTFPFQVTKQIVDKLIKTVKDDNMSSRAMYI
jgi:ATP-dependent Lon protease